MPGPGGGPHGGGGPRGGGSFGGHGPSHVGGGMHGMPHGGGMHGPVSRRRIYRDRWGYGPRYYGRGGGCLGCLFGIILVPVAIGVTIACVLL